MTNVPTNKKLYEKVKKEAKRKFNVWPSAYASGWLVRTYRQRGGKYKKTSPKRKSRRRRSTSRRKSPKRKSRRRRSVKMRYSKKKTSRRKTGLGRWFSEEWIDVCQLPKIVPCGRKSDRNSSRKYPYCRPRYKITSKSPRTSNTFSKAEITRRCKKKRRNPSKRVR